jgi:hypothetical protein
MMTSRVLASSIAVLLAASVSAQTPAQEPSNSELSQRQAKVATYTGTWTGTSTCVGDNPACKNEIVVYRFVPFPAAPWQTRCLADKIVGGKRLPMGALLFEYDDKTKGLRCEWKRNATHGVWSFTAEGDSLRGNYTSLPGGEKGRDVRAHRVRDESTLPPAPALKEYEE